MKNKLFILFLFLIFISQNQLFAKKIEKKSNFYYKQKTIELGGNGFLNFRFDDKDNYSIKTEVNLFTNYFLLNNFYTGINFYAKNLRTNNRKAFIFNLKKRIISIGNNTGYIFRIFDKLSIDLFINFNYGKYSHSDIDGLAVFSYSFINVFLGSTIKYNIYDRIVLNIKLSIDSNYYYNIDFKQVFYTDGYQYNILYGVSFLI